jgi:hypothetical protein
MLYDLQKTQRDRNGFPQILTDLVTTSKRRIYERGTELKKRGQQIRIIKQTGELMTAEEFEDLR